MSRAPTAEELQYMMTHVSDDTRGPMIASSAIGGLIAILCVVLRIMSRKMPGIPLKADDWWMVASLVCFHAYLRNAEEGSLINDRSCT
jgi:hypothetical protein